VDTSAFSMRRGRSQLVRSRSCRIAPALDGEVEITSGAIMAEKSDWREVSPVI